MEILAKLTFAVTQYLWLLILVLASFGAGHLMLGWGSTLFGLPRPFSVLIRIVAGLGVLIMVLFGIGMMGVLTVSVVGILLVLAVTAAGVVALRGICGSQDVKMTQWTRLVSWLRQYWFGFAAILLASLPLLLSPLQPPVDWDELMYHLPYARFWAEQGSLAVNTWLRYPLFPYNFNLLYAAVLLFDNDILTHLIHALAGWLTAAGVYFGATRFFDWRVGLLAAIMFLVAVLLSLTNAHLHFGNAYVDLGLTLFIFFGFLSLALWQERSDARWLYVSMFFMGLAVGTKYQGLFYLPLVGVLVLTRERRPLTLLKALAVFLVCGGNWYLRNYLISGNPIHPLGSEYFGYWLWDRGDLEEQLLDISRQATLPSWYLLSTVTGLLFLRGSSLVYKGICFIAFGAAILWAITSGYERYLMPAFPFFAIISAYSIIRLAELVHIDVAWNRWFGSATRGWTEWLKFTVLLLIGFISVTEGHHCWKRIFVTEQTRNAYLAKRFSSYDILRSIPDNGNWRVYQYGFEGEIYYYSPVLVIGDWFGLGRYRSVLHSGDAPALAAHLHALGMNALLINLSRFPMNSSNWGVDVRFPGYFEEVQRTPSAVLYKLRDSVHKSIELETGITNN